jgi:hypothetical protein
MMASLLVELQSWASDTSMNMFSGSLLSILRARSSSPDQLFFLQNAIFVSIWWIFICTTTKRPLYDVFNGSVVTVPSWLTHLDKNNGILLFLQRHARPPCFFAQTISFSLAFSFPHLRWVRLVSAVLYSIYHLVESSITNRHGEYPILYSMWAMCLIPDEYADFRKACVWGIAMNFVFSTGYAKLMVGGGLIGWSKSSTMKSYLNCYRQARHRMNRPLSPYINRMVAESKMLSSFVALSVLVVECFVVPGSVFLQPSQRPVVALAMIGMHIGIALVLSINVGLAFWTTIPCYLYGFSCSADFGSEQWWVALSITVGPTFCSWMLGERLLPEVWPFSPVSLFMWNGPVAGSLSKMLMVEDMRMVLVTEETALRNLTGLRVLPSLDVLSKKEMELQSSVVHDAVMRSIGFTLIRGGDPLIEAVQMLHQTEGLQRLVYRTWAWLQVEKGRLVELHTGGILSSTAIVRIDRDSGRILEVVIQ